MTQRLAVLTAGLFIICCSGAHATTTSCSTVAACVLGTNTSSGYGVEGTSKTNNGVVGTTEQPSTAASNGRTGVAGYDNSTNKGNTFRVSSAFLLTALE